MICYQAPLLVNILRNFSKPSLEIRLKLSIHSSSLRMNQTQLVWHQSWLKLDPICITHGKFEYSFWICDNLPNSVSRWAVSSFFVFLFSAFLFSLSLALTDCRCELVTSPALTVCSVTYHLFPICMYTCPKHPAPWNKQGQTAVIIPKMAKRYSFKSF